jgi:Na+-translocating ferredoxin:NAD+ oxidoreductase RNF subunit RnfB
MSMQIVVPLAVLGGLGVIFSLLLSFASRMFFVEVDERITRIRAYLPGANCGGCGYPGCDNLAAAIVEGNAKANACPVGGVVTAEHISSIMGWEKGDGFEDVAAYILCNGSEGNTREIYHYDGAKFCSAASQFGGGHKACRFACLGLGDCLRACKFGAITMVNQRAKIDPNKCTGCGSCVIACPKDVLKIMPAKVKVAIACKNVDAAKKVREVCIRGCIACKRCEKACEYDAIHVIGGLAQIDYDKCTGCGKCAAQCPNNCIKQYYKDEDFPKIQAAN